MDRKKIRFPEKTLDFMRHQWKNKSLQASASADIQSRLAELAGLEEKLGMISDELQEFGEDEVMQEIRQPEVEKLQEEFIHLSQRHTFLSSIIYSLVQQTIFLN